MEKEVNELEALNELLIINNDRVEGYMKAAALTKEHELKSLFHNMADESRTIARELATEMVKFDGLPSEGCHYPCRKNLSLVDGHSGNY